MLFPTEGENFGHVTAEALSVGCPVVCADTTPWTPMLNRGGRIVVEPDDSESWSRAIEAYARLGPLEIQKNRDVATSAFSVWRSEAAGRLGLFAMLFEADA